MIVEPIPRSRSSPRNLLRGAVIAVVLFGLAAAPISSFASPVAHATGPSGGASAVVAPNAPASLFGVPLGLSNGHATLSLASLPAKERAALAVPTALVNAARPSSSLTSHAIPSGSSASGASALRPAWPVPTPDNVYVNGSSCGTSGSIVQVGGSASNLAEEISSPYGLYNQSVGNATECDMRGGPTYAYAISNFTMHHGAAEVAMSADGGATWTDSWLNPNSTMWKNGSARNGTIPIGGGQIVSSTSSAGTDLFDVTPFNALCVYLWGQIGSQGLGSTIGFPGCAAGIMNSSVGVAVDVYDTTTHVWSDDHQLVNYTYWENLSSACGSYYGTNLTENPSIAAVASGSTYHVMAAWDVVNLDWSGTSCGSASVFENTWESYSSNGGVTWSTPKEIAGSGTNAIAEFVSIASEPSGAFDMVSFDWGNATSSTPNEVGILWSRSTNSGSSWTTADIAGGAILINPPNGEAPNSLIQTGSTYGLSFTGGPPYTYATMPVIAVDNWTGSPNHGRVYVAWTDNNSGTNLGDSIIAVTSTSTPSGNSGWTNETYVPVPSGVDAFDPALSTDSAGRLWVSYYGFQRSSGFFQQYAAVSANAGATFSAAFPVSDAATDPGSTIGFALTTVGQRAGIVGTSSGAIAAFTDCRNSNCSSTLETEIYTSHLFAASVALASTSIANLSTVLEANLTDNTYGVTSDYAVKWGTPAPTVWADAASHTESAPTSIPYNTTYLDAFQGWSGLATSTGTSVSFWTNATGTLTATYTPQKAAAINGTFSPITSQSSLIINGASVRLTPYNASADQFLVTLPAGSYTYSASAGSKYTSVSSQPVLASSGTTTTIHIVLTKIPGTLSIQVALPGGSDPNATVVTINGTSVPVGVNGAYVESEPWGYYFVNVSNPTAAAAPTQFEEVNPGAPTVDSVDLMGGYFTVTVLTSPTKTNAINVAVDNDSAWVENEGGGFYNVTCGSTYGCASGSYWISASETGYNSSGKEVTLSPGVGPSLTLHLTNFAFVTGYVTPISIVTNLTADKLSVEILNTSDAIIKYASTYDPVTGQFNVTVTGGVAYSLIATAKGYKTFTTTIEPIAPGTSTALIEVNLTANSVPVQTCQQTNTCSQTSGGGGNGSSTPFPTLLVGGIVIVVLLAIVAIALLMRRRSGGASGGGDAGMATDGSSDAMATDGTSATPDWQEPPASGGSS